MAVDPLSIACVPRHQRSYSSNTWREVRARQGFLMEVDLGDWLGRHLYVTGEYEPATTHVIAELLHPGRVFLDVGANLGYFSLLAAKR